MAHNQNQEGMLALLKWYTAMGVDDAIGTDPINWLLRSEKPPGETIRKAIQTQTEPFSDRLPPLASGQPNLDLNSKSESGELFTTRNTTLPTRRLASAFTPEQSLLPHRKPHKMHSRYQNSTMRFLAFDGCGLKATAKNTCFYRGAERTDVVIIGEAPGRDEDLQGRPFVGRAGKLLDLMLASIVLKATLTSPISSIGGHPATALQRHKKLNCVDHFSNDKSNWVAPKFVLLLGGAAAKQILETTQGIMRLRANGRK